MNLGIIDMIDISNSDGVATLWSTPERFAAIGYLAAGEPVFVIEERVSSRERISCVLTRFGVGYVARFFIECSDDAEKRGRR